MTNYNFLYEDFESHIASNFKLKVIMQYDVDDAYFFEIKTITINRSNPWKHRFYSLLHEFGHFIIMQDKEKYDKTYPKSKTNRTTRKDIISIVSEEIRAWDVGREYLETNMGVDIDQKYFNRLKTNCVMSYIVTSLNDAYGKKIDVSKININS